MGGKRGEPRTASVGANQDIGHLWEEEELKRIPSMRLSA
jgi:hypothetical protein